MHDMIKYRFNYFRVGIFILIRTILHFCRIIIIYRRATKQEN